MRMSTSTGTKYCTNRKSTKPSRGGQSSKRSMKQGEGSISEDSDTVRMVHTEKEAPEEQDGRRATVSEASSSHSTATSLELELELEDDASEGGGDRSSWSSGCRGGEPQAWASPGSRSLVEDTRCGSSGLGESGEVAMSQSEASLDVRLG